MQHTFYNFHNMLTEKIQWILQTEINSLKAQDATMIKADWLLFEKKEVIPFESVDLIPQFDCGLSIYYKF